MPSSVHRILILGADIIENAVLPIGMLSEEAFESRNKDFRYVREHHTRKISRESNVQDLFNNLLFSSDPYISSLSSNPTNRNVEPLCRESIALLSDSSILNAQNHSEDETDSETSSDE